MKKLIYILSLIILLGACSKDDVQKIVAKDINISPNKLKLAVLETAQLIAQILPEQTVDKTVTWTSADESIATVSNSGLVTAINEGKVLISATTANSISSTCEVVVDKNIISATEIKIVSESNVFFIGKSLQLSVSILPIGTTDKTVVWTSSNDKIAKVSDSGLVSPISEGSVEISATTVNGLIHSLAFTVKDYVSKEDEAKQDEINKILLESSFGWLSTSFIDEGVKAPRLLFFSFTSAGIANVNSECTRPIASKYSVKVRGNKMKFIIETYAGFIEPRIVLDPSSPSGPVVNMELDILEYSKDKLVLSFKTDSPRKLTLNKLSKEVDFSKQKAMRAKLGGERTRMFAQFNKDFPECNKNLTLCITKGIEGASVKKPVKIGFSYSTMTSTVDLAYNWKSSFTKGLSMLVFTETGFVSAQSIALGETYISSFKYNETTSRFEIDDNGIEGHFECLAMPAYEVNGTTDGFLSGYSLWMKSFNPTELDKLMSDLKKEAADNEFNSKIDVAYLVTKYKRREPLFNADGSPKTLDTGEQDYELKEELGDGILFSFVYAYQFYYYFVPLKAIKLGEDKIRFERTAVPSIHMKNEAYNAIMLDKCNSNIALNKFVDTICDKDGLHIKKSELEGSFDFDFRFLSNPTSWFMGRNK